MDEEIDIVNFIKMIRKFETFYQELGHKQISPHIKAQSEFKIVQSSSDENVNPVAIRPSIEMSSQKLNDNDISMVTDLAKTVKDETLEISDFENSVAAPTRSKKRIQLVVNHEISIGNIDENDHDSSSKNDDQTHGRTQKQSDPWQNMSSTHNVTTFFRNLKPPNMKKRNLKRYRTDSIDPFDLSLTPSQDQIKVIGQDKKMESIINGSSDSLSDVMYREANDRKAFSKGS